MPTTREVLETTIDLEKRSMALYARFAKTFRDAYRACMSSGSGWRVTKRATSVRSTWSPRCSNSKAMLDQAKPDPVLEGATSSGCATLLESLSERACRESVDSSERSRLRWKSKRPNSRRWSAICCKALQQHDEYERCQRLLVHDLGELSYMIEQYCQDPALLQRCDELVNHHAETLRLSAAGR